MNIVIVDATKKHKIVQIVDFKNYKRTLLDPGSPDCFHRRIPPWNMFDLNSGRYHAEKDGIKLSKRLPVPDEVISSLLAAAGGYGLCPSIGECSSQAMGLIEYADESGAFEHCANALTKLGKFMEEHGQPIKAHSFYRRALAIGGEGENEEAKNAYWSILSKVNEIDNKQLENLAKKREKLCQVEAAKRHIQWGDALRDIFYSQIYHACRMEKKLLDKEKVALISQEDIYEFLRINGKGLDEIVKKKVNEIKSHQCDEDQKDQQIAYQTKMNILDMEAEKVFNNVGKKPANIEHFAIAHKYILNYVEKEKEKEKLLYAEEEAGDDEGGNDEEEEDPNPMEVYQTNFKEIENVAKAHAFMYSHKCSGGKFTFQFLTNVHEVLVSRIANTEHEVEQTGKVYEIEEDEHPTMVRDAFSNLCNWVYAEMELGQLDSVSLAAITYYYMIALHPFADANGRSTRLATNYILMTDGFPPVTSPSDTLADKHKYFHLIRTAHNGDIRPFIRFTAHLLDQTMDKLLYCANCTSPLDYRHLLDISPTIPQDLPLECPKAKFVGPLIDFQKEQIENAALEDTVFIQSETMGSPINKSGSTVINEDSGGKKSSSNAQNTSSTSLPTIPSHSSDNSITYYPSFVDWANLFMQAITPSPEPRIVD